MAAFSVGQSISGGNAKEVFGGISGTVSTCCGPSDGVLPFNAADFKAATNGEAAGICSLLVVCSLLVG
jgi:hypothetical protein